MLFLWNTYNYPVITAEQNTESISLKDINQVIRLFLAHTGKTLTVLSQGPKTKTVCFHDK